MDWLRTLLSRCTAFFVTRKLDGELDEELGSHIEFAIQENLSRGMSDEDARTTALRQFGGVTQIKESYRLRRGLPLLDTLAQDIRFAARQMMRAPAFAAVAVLIRPGRQVRPAASRSVTSSGHRLRECFSRVRP